MRQIQTETDRKNTRETESERERQSEMDRQTERKSREVNVKD